MCEEKARLNTWHFLLTGFVAGRLGKILASTIGELLPTRAECTR